MDTLPSGIPLRPVASAQAPEGGLPSEYQTEGFRALPGEGEA